MSHPTILPPRRSTGARLMAVRLLGVLLLGSVVLLGGQDAAQAQGGEVRLTGTNANNFFIIELVDNATLEFCTDTVGCFTRARSVVDRVAIECLDGDDGVFIKHKAGLVSHTTLPLSLTFDGGLGNDELRICTIDACTAGVTTDITLLPETDEVRVVQCLGRTSDGDRCVDLPFQAPVSTLKINARGTDLVTDFSAGPLTVVGTPADDVVTMQSGTVFRNTFTGSDETVGEILVNTAASIRVLNKDAITLDTGSGQDTVSVNASTGLIAAPTGCARDGVGGTVGVCVYAGDEPGDVLQVPAGGGAEATSLTLRPSGASRLAGLAGPPTIDLAGIDAMTIPQQPSQGDTFTLAGTPVDDALAVDATVVDRLVLTGQVATNTTIPAPVPAVTLTGDGTGPLAATMTGGGGTDAVALTTGSEADEVSAVPTPATCPTGQGVCITSTANGIAHHAIAMSAERLDISTGDGTDTLDVAGDIATQLHWHAGAGGDRLDFASAGQPVTADLGGGSVAEDLAGGAVVVDEVETLDVDVAGTNLTVVGTPGADVLRYTPVDETRGTVALDGDTRTINASGVAGTMTLDPAAGDDTVAVDATTGDDSIAIFRGATVTTQIGQTLPVRSSAATESLALAGRSGDDRFLVSGDGGPTAITVDGGIHTGADRISFAAAIADAAVTFDAAPASGTIAADGPPIAFRDLEAVDAEGSDTGTFSVFGSDSGDTIVQDAQTVTVGRGTIANFSRYPTLAMHGLAGNDDVVLSPRTLPATMTGVTVDGGAAGVDTVVVNASELRETIRYTPTSSDGGTVMVSLAPPISLAGTEAVEVDGGTTAPTGDTLLVTSPAIDGTIVATPGAAIDAGSISLADATGAITSFPVLHYGQLGRGTVVIDGADGGGATADRVRVAGEPDADVFDLAGDGLGGSTVVLDSRIPVVTTAVHTVQLLGADGPDTFHLPTDHALDGAPGPAITVDGGSSSVGDIAVITANGGGVLAGLADGTVQQTGFRPIATSGLDRIDLRASGQPVTAVGGNGPDAVTVTPTDPGGAHVVSNQSSTLIDLAGASSLAVDTGDGADLLLVAGRSIPDDIRITRGSAPVVAVDDLLAVTATTAVEAVTIDGREGGDLMTVDGQGGPLVLALDGGHPPGDGDEVRLVAADATVDFGDPPTGGSLSSPGGDLSFDGFDTVTVEGDGTGALTATGTDAPDTITLGDPGIPAVRLNAGAELAYTGFPTLHLDGRGGADQFDINYANLGDLQAITISGGSSADDQVAVTDTLGTTRTVVASPADGDHIALAGDGGVPTIDASGVGGISFSGRGVGDHVTVVSPDGAQDIAVAPGPGVGDAVVRVGSLVPVSFADIGADGSLAINTPTSAAEDHVVLTGSTTSDDFRVQGVDRQIVLDGFVPVRADGAAAVTLLGMDGSDTFTATGPLPWATTTFEGGGPANGDHVALDGPVGEAVVDINNAAVTGFGGIVRIPEVSTLQTSHGNHGLTMVGTDTDDAICYDPLTPRDGRVHIIASPNGGLLTDSCQPTPGTLDILHTFVDVGHLVLDPGAGADQVLVNGTVNDDAVIIESTGDQVAVSVNPNPADTASVRLAVSIISPSTENVIVSTDNGKDDIDVRLYEALGPVFTVHGEAPDSRNADHLTVRDLSGAATLSDTKGEPHNSGTVSVHWRRFSGIELLVNYTGMEKVRTYKVQRPK